MSPAGAVLPASARAEDRASAASEPLAPPSESMLAERYAGQDSAELMGRVRHLQQVVEVEAAAHFQRLRDEGRYRSLPIPRDAQGRALNQLQALGRSDAIRHVFELPERDEWRVVELPRAEFPGLYRIWDEKLWIVRRIEQLEHVDED